MYRAKFVCPVCEGEAEALIQLLPGSRHWAFETEAQCQGCGSRYYKRDADLPWWAPPARVAELEVVQKNLPDGELGDEFVRRAADALTAAILPPQKRS